MEPIEGGLGLTRTCQPSVYVVDVIDYLRSGKVSVVEKFWEIVPTLSSKEVIQEKPRTYVRGSLEQVVVKLSENQDWYRWVRNVIVDSIQSVRLKSGQTALVDGCSSRSRPFDQIIQATFDDLLSSRGKYQLRPTPEPVII